MPRKNAVRPAKVNESDSLWVDFSFFNPAPNGHELSADDLVQTHKDLAPFSVVTVADPPCLALIAKGDEAVLIIEHRFRLLLHPATLDSTLGHLMGYSETILCGHPVQIGVTKGGRSL